MKNWFKRFGMLAALGLFVGGALVAGCNPEAPEGDTDVVVTEDADTPDVVVTEEEGTDTVVTEEAPAPAVE